MVDLARLENLKRLLNDGTLTREEFEALKQKELQADGTDRGDCGSDCASERSASPAPVIGAPVYGAATGNAVPGAPGASSAPTLAEMGEVFRKDLGVGGTNLVELVEASCVVLGVSVKGKSLAQQANECWRILNGAKLPAGQVSAGGCGDSTGGMKTDPFAVPATHGGPHERIAERLSRVRASAALSASRRSSTRVAPAITKSASSVSSGLAVDTETSAGSAADDCKYINRSKDSYASQLGFPSTGKLPSDPFPETPPQGTDRAAASTLAPDATPVVLGTPAPRGELEARQEKPSRQRALHLTRGNRYPSCRHHGTRLDGQSLVSAVTSIAAAATISTSAAAIFAVAATARNVYEQSSMGVHNGGLFVDVNDRGVHGYLHLRGTSSCDLGPFFKLLPQRRNVDCTQSLPENLLRGRLRLSWRRLSLKPSRGLRRLRNH